MNCSNPGFWRACGSCGALLVVAGAVAGVSQSTLVSPGGFVQAAADIDTSSFSALPGDDLVPFINGPGSQLNESVFSGLGQETQSAAVSSTNINLNSDGLIGMGYAVYNAFCSAPGTSHFPFALATGGWKDTFTVSNPLYTGQAGFMQFTVDATGFIKATGFSGAASIRIAAHKDNVSLLKNQFFNPGNSVPLGTDRQYGNWSVASFANPDVQTLSVNGTVTFAVPITFGTPFTLGVYSRGVGSTRSQSSIQTIGTGRTENAIVRWGGIVNIYAGTTPVSGSTVISLSGKDWGPATQVPDACPGDLNNDGFVDDADFVIFVNSYNILDCADPSMPAGCPADLNSDGFVDDADFVLFAEAYEELLCP
jgi:hypothetical protein